MSKGLLLEIKPHLTSGENLKRYSGVFSLYHFLNSRKVRVDEIKANAPALNALTLQDFCILDVVVKETT